MIGHKAAECTVRINEVEYGAEMKEGPQVASVDIGRVWNLCQVEIANRIETSNRFGVLCEDDDEEEQFLDLSSGALESLKPKCSVMPSILHGVKLKPREDGLRPMCTASEGMFSLV